MTTYNWYRVHHGMVSDPKWPLIAKNSGQNVGTVVAVWCALLDYASQNDTRGTIDGFVPAVIDVLYGCNNGTTESILTAMKDLSMIVDGVIVSWEKRQAAEETAGRKKEPEPDPIPLRPEDFNTWYYGKYPRKEAKKPAIIAWNNAIVLGILPPIPVLLEALEWQIPANDWTPKRKHYIPLPATYLNDRRWEDERPQAQTAHGSTPHAQDCTTTPGRPMTLDDIVEHNSRICKEILAEFVGAEAVNQTTETCTALPGAGHIESQGETQ